VGNPSAKVALVPFAIAAYFAIVTADRGMTYNLRMGSGHKWRKERGPEKGDLDSLGGDSGYAKTEDKRKEVKDAKV